ncbi:MAG TPA: hypothetical protein VEL79_02545 [Vicinamibacterales bacterium]|nr:hypothetical protein [Vicinamibacterales bacterium]
MSDKPALLKRSAWLLWVLALVWLTGVTAGLSAVWAYENRPGADAKAPARWPSQSTLVRANDRPTLVFVAHPQCTCTRASIQELAEALARSPKHPKAYVLFLRPTVFDAGWEKTGLWHSAAALPGVTVVRDDDGVEARRFGVETSGQIVLYDSRGGLIFSGGITGSRAHAGDNAGQTALVGLLTRGAADRSAASVFGCPLFAHAE